MSKEFYIENYVRIKQNKVFLNGKLIFKAEEEHSVSDFLKKAYKEFEINYPKFHKMDGLSKLGILSSELLAREKDFSAETALVFANSTSSLETDKEYQKTISKIASPALFVYTLPNIVLGEISIKHKLLSENAFFIAEEFEPDLFYDYTHSLLNESNSEALCGWVDLQNEEYDVFLFRVSGDGNLPFTPEKLEELYGFTND